MKSGTVPLCHRHNLLHQRNPRLCPSRLRNSGASSRLLIFIARLFAESIASFCSSRSYPCPKYTNMLALHSLASNASSCSSQTLSSSSTHVPSPLICKSILARARGFPFKISFHACFRRTLAVFVLALDASFLFVIFAIFALGLDSTELLQRHFGTALFVVSFCPQPSSTSPAKFSPG